MLVDQVVDDRLGRPDLLAPAVGGLADDLVGVLAVGQADDPDLVELDARVGDRELPDQRLEGLGSERPGLLAGRVDVVGQGDLRRVAGEERDLAGRQGGPERGHDVVEARLMGHQRVRVALDDHGLAALPDRALGAVDQVERPALVEERRRRGVEVLRAMVLAVVGRVPEDPPAKPDRAAAGVADREDHPLAEPVVDAAAGRLAGLGEPDLDEVVGPDLALRGERPGERVPAAGRVAQLVGRDRRVGEAPAAEVVEGRLARLRGGEDRVVERDRTLHHVAKAGLAGILAGRPLVDLDPGLAGEDLERLREGQPVALHHEAEDVAALAAAEALPGVAGRGDGERRGLLAVEWAEALERRPGLLQLDGLADDVDHAQLALHLGSDTDRQDVLPPGRCRAVAPWWIGGPPRSPRGSAGHDCGLVKS